MTTDRDLQQLTELLAESSEALLDLAPTQEMAEHLDAAPRPARPANPIRHWLPLAASLAAVFIVGAMIGRYFFPTVPEYTGPPRWITAAVDHTNLYTTETMLANPLDDDQKMELVASASRHVETDLDAIANATERAYFQNGDLMEYKGRQLVQLNFLYDTGTPFAVYILRTPDTDGYGTLLAGEIRKWQIEELASSRWERPGYELYAVGRLTREQMDDVAAAVDRNLAKVQERHPTGE